MDGVNTRKVKKKKKKKKREEEESEGRRKIYSQPSPVRSSSPLQLWRAHFATVSVTRCTFLLARVLAYSLSLSLSLSLSFFRVLPPLFTTLIVLRVWLQTSRALSLAKNAISAMTFHQGTNIVRSTYLFHYWLERYLSFFPFVISMLAKCINSNFLHLHNLLDSITKVIMNGWTCKRNVIRRQLLLRFDVAK